MARILIVSEYFHRIDSPRALRTKELSLELVKQGHFVKVICSISNLPTEYKTINNLSFEDLGEKNPNKFPLFRLLFGVRLHYFLNKILLILFEYPNILLFNLVRLKLKKEAKYDLLISIGQPYPIHWGVASIWSNRIANKWVADCGDPYALLKNDSYSKPFYFNWIEKWFMKKCDFVSIPIDAAKNSYFKEFSSKLVVIPQGLTFPIINTSFSRSEGTIHFAYFGDIYPYQKPAVRFLNFLSKQNVDFKFKVYSKGADFFKNKIENQMLKKCEINTPIDRCVLLSTLKDVDFLVYFPYEKPGQQPFKLVDYTFLGKPIICFDNNVKSEQILLEFLHRNYSNKSVGVDLENYRIENVANQFLSLI
jgi:hypothetical protein